jgi:long-chain acyl-CoA synthetase
MNIALWLERSAKAFPQRVALVSGLGDRLSYSLFAAAAGGLGRSLRDRLNIAGGDRVAVLSANCAECMLALYGIWWAGAAAVPINAKLHPREAAFILGDAGCRVCFVSPEWHTMLQEIVGDLPAGLHLVVLGGDEFQERCTAQIIPPVTRNPDHLAWLFYTSGTTGKPKGAMLSHGNLQAMTFNYFTDVDSIDTGDCILHAAPVSHGSGLYNFAHVLRGASQVFPASGGFDPAEIAGLLADHPGMTMFAAPTMVKRLTEYVEQSGGDTGNLKTIVYGGGPMYVADLKRAIAVFGNKFVEIYGQGESPMTITALGKFHHTDIGHPNFESRLASVGQAHSGVEVRLRDDHGNDVAPNELGEICVRGETVMLGYWNNPGATAHSLRDGWLWTGDLAVMDEDGFVTLKARSKELIISGGSNIYPREIEEVLLKHPGVQEAAVIGKPDAEWGESVVAFVVMREGVVADAVELDRVCLDHVARFKRPKEYRFVDSLPKNNYGKVLKIALRELL